MEARPEPTPVRRTEPSLEPKRESALVARPEVRPEAVVAPKGELPRAETHVQPQLTAKAEPRPEPTLATRPPPQIEPSSPAVRPVASAPEPLAEVRPQARAEPKPVPRGEPQPQMRPEAKQQPTYEARAEPGVPAPLAAPAPPGPARPSAVAAPTSPVALTPLPTPPKLKRGDEDAAILRFRSEVVRIVGKVVSERDYPRLARERGWQGLSTVRVEIGPDGLLKAVTVTRSSGFSVLDDRAVSKIREIKLPNIPDELRERAFSVDVPFRFSLRNRQQ
jgi:TonB family protein